MARNHAAQASLHIDQAERWSPEDAVQALALAQIHATLALVEEQRTANLIALATATVADTGQVLYHDDAIETLRAARDRLALDAAVNH